jgi:hypothetical protein
VLGFCGLYNFSDTCKNEKNNNVNKTVKEGGPREQLPRTFKEGGPREQLPRT